MFKATTGDKLIFNIKVGVADTYSLTLKYHNPLTTAFRAKITFSAADGTLMKVEEVNFSPTKAGKWNYLTTNTGTMINAGNYRVAIVPITAKGLYIDALDVQ